MPALAGDNILVGKVKKAGKETSEITTLFSPEWKNVVVVGKERVRAVLRGGLEPELELAENPEKIKEGDMILNSSPEFPLGALLGRISEKNLVETGYDLDEMRHIFIDTGL